MLKRLKGPFNGWMRDLAFESLISCQYPSPLNYRGFPKSVCTSVNNVVCHGIPDDRPLADGDVINVDVTVYVGGFHGDCSKTFLVGDVDSKGRKLVEVNFWRRIDKIPINFFPKKLNLLIKIF